MNLLGNAEKSTRRPCWDLRLPEKISKSIDCSPVLPQEIVAADLESVEKARVVLARQANAKLL